MVHVSFWEKTNTTHTDIITNDDEYTVCICISNLWSQYLSLTLLPGVLLEENTTSIYKPSNVHLLLPCCRAPPVWTAWGNDAYWLHFQSAAWQSPLCPELRHPASPAPGSRSKAGEDTHVNNRINTKNMLQILFSIILLLLLFIQPFVRCWTFQPGPTLNWLLY